MVSPVFTNLRAFERGVAIQLIERPLVFARQQVTYPVLAPPGIPADRTAALRQTFLETMKDQDLLADAAQAKLEIMPAAGAQIQRLITELYATPAHVVAKTSEM